MSSVGKQYIVFALFRNILTCLSGNQACKFFQLVPLSLPAFNMKDSKHVFKKLHFKTWKLNQLMSR